MPPKVGAEQPYHINFVLGTNGGMKASARDLAFLADSMPKGSHITVSGIGKTQFNMAAIAIAETSAETLKKAIARCIPSQWLFKCAVLP